MPRRSTVFTRSFRHPKFAFDPRSVSLTLGRMKHAGKARKAAFKLILVTLIAVLILWGLVFVATVIGAAMTVASFVLLPLWGAFALFTLYFFRDPNARVPSGANL